MIFQRKRLMLPRYTRPAISQLDLPEDELSRMSFFIQKWEGAKERYFRLIREQNGIPFSSRSSALPPSFSPKVQSLIQDPRFQNAFGSRAYEFRMVDIDSLVAYQEYVNLDFVSAYSGTFPPALTDESIFDICLSLDKNAAPVSRVRIDESSYLFSSDSQDFRIVDVIPKSVDELNARDLSSGLPVTALMVILGYGLPLAFAYQAGPKLFLANGFHRLFALRARGVKQVPLLIVKEPSPKELVAAARSVPFEFIVNDARPPLMKDFFDEDLVVDLNEKPKRRSIRVTIDREYFDVPL